MSYLDEDGRATNYVCAVDRSGEDVTTTAALADGPTLPLYWID